VDTLGRPLAEWWQRLVAIIIDSVILGIVTGIISAVIIAAGHYVGNGNGLFSTRLDARHVIAGLITFVIDLAYFALLNGSDKGQTVGMMALGITVRDNETGGRIDPQRAGLRIFVLYPGILLRWIPVLGAISGVYTIVVGPVTPLGQEARRVARQGGQDDGHQSPLSRHPVAPPTRLLNVGNKRCRAADTCGRAAIARQTLHGRLHLERQL
jgi:uncharacterized RDD family membrane protein YckC